MRESGPTVTRLGPVMAILIVACGCNFAPQYKKPSAEVPPFFKESDGWKVAQPDEAAIRGNWWEIFEDEQLNVLEASVDISNQNVAAALANLAAARAVVRQSRSEFFPTVTAQPGVTRTRQANVNNFVTSTTSGRRGTTTIYSLPFDASWEADLWGRVRNTVAANSTEATATLADLENTRLSMTAELASDYFQLRGLDAQRELLNSTVTAYEESLRLARVRYDTGLASDQDVAQAETQLNTTKAQATDVGIQRAQLEHAIAVLAGKAPAELSIPAAPLKANLKRTPVSLPATLLERRPDIAAAERRVASANAQIGVARAAYFPALSLTGGGGFQSASLGSLISSSAFTWSVGANLAQTLFDAGRRRAVTEQARAIYERTVAGYRQAVLTAFQDVEDNLSTLRILEQEIEEQDAAVKSSQRYLTLANDRYRLGIDSYLNIIAAQTSTLNNQRTAVNLRTQQAVATVQLIKAVGGGWTAAQLEPTKSTTTNTVARANSP